MGWVPIVIIGLLSLTSSFTQAQRTYRWYDFETTATLPKFETFGTDYEVFENPEMTATNPSLLVGRVVKIPGSIQWSGLLVNTPNKVNLVEGGCLKMKVYATTKGGTVHVKLEGGPKSPYTYSSKKIYSLNEWQDLTFCFGKSSWDYYSKLVIMFDYGAVEDHVYYFDDLVWVEGDIRNLKE